MTNRREKQLQIVLVILIILVVGVTLLKLLSQAAPTANVPLPAPVSTYSPQVVLNLTLLPKATPLSEADARPYVQLRGLVNSCPDYSQERRDQMMQHIAWLIDPSTLPRDVILALGDQPAARLIEGMATYTLSDWGLHNRAPDSCLLAIGRTLNAMLIALGDQPLKEFN